MASTGTIDLYDSRVTLFLDNSTNDKVYTSDFTDISSSSGLNLPVDLAPGEQSFLTFVVALPEYGRVTKISWSCDGYAYGGSRKAGLGLMVSGYNTETNSTNALNIGDVQMINGFLGSSYASYSSVSDERTFSQDMNINEGNYLLFVLGLTTSTGIGANRNQSFRLRNFEFSIDYDTPPRHSLSIVNSIPGDTFITYQYTNNAVLTTGPEVAFWANEAILWKAKTIDGRKIERLRIYYNEALLVDYDSNTLKNELQLLNADENEFQYTDALSTGTYKFEIVFQDYVSFEIKSVNQQSSDTIQLYNSAGQPISDTLVYLGLENARIYYDASAGRGRRIYALHIKVSGIVEQEFIQYGPQLYQDGLINNTLNKFFKEYVTCISGQNRGMRIIFTFYFDDRPYKIYVGQTRAIDAYISDQVILYLTEQGG